MTVETSPRNSQPNYLYNVLYIGISFMVLFSALGICENMISHLYKEMGFTNLGRICLFIIYISFASANMVAPHFKRKITAKAGISGASFGYLFFILTGTLTTYCYKSGSDGLVCSRVTIYSLNLVFSVCLGFASSILWLCQCNYVNDCTNETNKGTYHGIFMMLMQLSNLIGSVAAAFILGRADEFTFFIVLTCFAVVSVVLLKFLPEIQGKQEQPAAEENQEPLAVSIKKFLDCYKDSTYYPVIISSFVSGLIVAFYATYLPVVIRETALGESQNIINQMVSFGFIGLGLGQIVTGPSVGRIIDRFPKFKISEVIFANMEIALVVSFFAMETQSFTLALIAGFLFGSCDNGANSLSVTLISTRFNGKLELFALYRATQCSGIVFGTLCTIFFGDQVGSIYILGILALIFCCHVMFNMTYGNMKPKKELDIELLERGFTKTLSV